MEAKVKFHPAQEVPSAELNAIQDFAQVSIDATIKNLLVRNVFYVGMTVSKSSATEISVDAGRLWADGRAYVRETAASINLTAYLPAGSNKKVLAVVASGATSDEESAPRKFLVDPNTRTVRPRTVETRTERNVVVAVVDGVAAINPVPPVVDIGYAILGTVTLSATGIVGEPEQVLGQRAPNLEDVVGEVAIMRGELDAQLGMIRTLRTDLSALAAKIAGLATKADIDALWKAIRDLQKGSVLPPPASSSYTDVDEFDNTAKSDIAHANYAADVSASRLALPRPASTNQAIALLNPLDTRVVTHANGLVLPAYTLAIRLANLGKTSTVALASYPVVTKTKTQLFNGILLKYRKINDVGITKAIQQANGVVELKDPQTGNTLSVDLTRYTWRRESDDTWGCWIYIEDWEPYWTESSVTATVTGSTIAQTFLNAQAGWLKEVTTHVETLAANGDMRLVVCEVAADGTPDLARTLTDMLLPYATLAEHVTSGNQVDKGWARFEIVPIHLSAGKRYAIVLQSAGAHKLFTSDGNDVANGTLFYAADATTWTNLGKDLAFKLKFCSFTATYQAIELTPISLTGGMDGLDFAATGIHPAAVGLTLQAQVDGVWRNVDGTDETTFVSRPQLVPLRMVFQNTKDDAFGLILSQSRVFASRASLSAVHVSTVNTVPSAGTVTSIVVEHELAYYDAGQHTIAVKILHGASYATSVNASATTVELLANGNKKVKAVFTTPAINSFKMRTEMTVTDSANEFVSLARNVHAQ